MTSARSSHTWSSGRDAGRFFWSLWLSGAAYLLLAVALAYTPLFDLLGYEFCVALSFLVSITAGIVAMAVVRKRLSQVFAGHISASAGAADALYLRALVVNCLLLILPLAVILLNTIRVQNCNLTTGLAFFVLLPIATAMVVTTWGATIGLLIRRRYLGGLSYAALWMLIAGYHLWGLWSGPAMDSYNQIVGWFAGPIYDEIIEVGLPLASARLFGLSWGLCALFFVSFMARTTHDPAARRRTGAWTIVFFVAALGLTYGRFVLGFGRSTEQVLDELSGVTTTSHFVIHHSPDIVATEATLIAEDHEFRYGQLQRMFGLSAEDGAPIHSYLFTSASQKRRLVGAGHTQFSKPWQRSMYLNGTEFPHPILKHELTHVVASAFGSRPFGVSARYGLWLNLGLTEGLATAAESSVHGFDLHSWSAAMRRAGHAPRLIELFSPVGFWTAAGQRSYILAGSFVSFLLSTYGPEKFKEAYSSGELSKAYPKTPSELINDWEHFLDTLPLDESLVEAARARFAQPSLFARPCAHEIATIRKEVFDALGATRCEFARKKVARLITHLPDDVEAQMLRVEIHRCADETDATLSEGLKLLERPDLNVAQRAALHSLVGDLLARKGVRDQAREHYQEVVRLSIDRASDRMACIKIEALDRGPAGMSVIDYLDRKTSDAAHLLALHEAALQADTWAAAWYVLGRQLFNHQQFKQAIPYLQRAGALGLADPALGFENLRLLAIARYHTGDRIGAALILTVLFQFPNGAGQEPTIQDWLERIAYDERR